MRFAGGIAALPLTLYYLPLCNPYMEEEYSFEARAIGYCDSERLSKEAIELVYEDEQLTLRVRRLRTADLIRSGLIPTLLASVFGIPLHWVPIGYG
jgi:hypothetical protein